MTPALLTRMFSGPSHAATNDATDAGSARSTCATRMWVFPVVASISEATRFPASVSRTARVTSAPVVASARGLGADTGCPTGHDDPAAGQIDPGDNLGGGGFPFEGRGDRLGHSHAGSRVFGGTAEPTLDFMDSDAVRRSTAPWVRDP